MNSIVGSVMRLVIPQVTSSLASRLGGTSSSVQSGIGSGVAALISGIATRTGDLGFVARLFNLVRASDMNSVLNNLPGLVSDTSSSLATEQGSKLTSMLFGDRQTAIETMVGHHAGLDVSAGRELMSLAASLTAGVLGQQIHEQGLNVFSFSNFINLESAKTKTMLPVGMGNLLSNGPVSSAHSTDITTPSHSGIGKEAVPLLGLLVLALIAWPLSGGCRSQKPTPSAPVEQAVSAPAPGPLGEFIKRKLPDGVELNIPRLGIENKLIDFIEDSSRPVDKATWFDFDRLTFDIDAATLQQSSTEQLQNIAAILKAYPRIKAKIGGYTDNTGDKDANLKLSESRATNVMHEFVSRGIDPLRLEAKGYGEEHPVADNATEEGRQKNRRISLLITEK